MSVERINGEPVELVERFEDLRVGDLIWVLPCDICGGRHRAILERAIAHGVGRDVNNEVDFAERCGLVWIGLPAPRCTGLPIGIPDFVVEQRQCYRVVDPPRAEPADAEATPRALERIR